MYITFIPSGEQLLLFQINIHFMWITLYTNVSYCFLQLCTLQSALVSEHGDQDVLAIFAF